MQRNWLVDIRGKLTQEQTAKLANISRSAYSNIELGLRNPSVPVAKNIAKALGFKWQYFFEQEFPKTKHKKTDTA